LLVVSGGAGVVTGASCWSFKKRASNAWAGASIYYTSKFMIGNSSLTNYLYNLRIYQEFRCL
jgi:hypothetical protein